MITEFHYCRYRTKFRWLVFSIADNGQGGLSLKLLDNFATQEQARKKTELYKLVDKISRKELQEILEEIKCGKLARNVKEQDL